MGSAWENSEELTGTEAPEADGRYGLQETIITPCMAAAATKATSPARSRFYHGSYPPFPLPPHAGHHGLNCSQHETILRQRKALHFPPLTCKNPLPSPH